MDRAGRVLIPKALRDEWKLAPGDTLVLEGTPEQATLKPDKEQGVLKKKKGIWVFYGEPVSAAEAEGALDRMREERIRDLLR